ncbi:hypothetical protein Hdeb2414_s0014g00421941 [Helianthus debilis subsp. tardiflorus]
MWRLNKLVKVVQVVLVVVKVVMLVMVGVKALRLRQNLVKLPLAIPFIPSVHQVLEVVLLQRYLRVMSLEMSKLDLGIVITQHVTILPHAPRWHLTQGSWMNDHANCQEFFNLSLPPAERLFQKRRNRFDILDDHIHARVNFFATSQEIVREWKLMGEETLEFENEKKAFAEEREKFNAEKKGLLWREWETACERTNTELQSQRNAIVRFSGEKKKISEEAEQARVASQKREEEYLQRIAKLEKLVEEKVVEIKASELLAEEVSADCKWLLAHAVPPVTFFTCFLCIDCLLFFSRFYLFSQISERIVKSHELANYMFKLGQAAYNHGRKDGYSEGRAAAANNEKDYHFELYKEDCAGSYAAKRHDYEFLEFGIVKVIDKLSRRANAIEILKKALGDSRTKGGAGPSHQD